MSDRIASVYAYHSGDYHYRYCGVTAIDPQNHFLEYEACALRGYRRTLFDWIRENSDRVRVVVLEECDYDIRYEREKYWITKLFREGYRLVNETWGGVGYTDLTPEARYKILGDLTDPEYDAERREKISKTMLDKWANDTEFREKASNANREMWTRPEYRNVQDATWTAERRARYAALQRQQRTGTKHRQETIDKIRAAHVGRPNKGAHVRHHVNKGVVNPSCELCRQETI